MSNEPAYDLLVRCKGVVDAAAYGKPYGLHEQLSKDMDAFLTAQDEAFRPAPEVVEFPTRVGMNRSRRKKQPLGTQPGSMKPRGSC